jgi:hypothetical protein
MGRRIAPRDLWDRIDKLRDDGLIDLDEHDRLTDPVGAGVIHEERLDAELDAIEFPPPRWSAFTDRELGAIIGAFEAADRDSSIDDVGKALHAQADDEMDGRYPPRTHRQQPGS